MKDTILIVDDEPAVLSALVRSLRSDAYDVVTAPGGEEALHLIRNRDIRVVISDQKMSRIQGIDFLALVKQHRPAIVRILLTGNADLDLALDAVNRVEVFRMLTKPWNDMELKNIVLAALAKSQTNLRATPLSPFQRDEREELERLHPGITRLHKDSDGSLVIEDLSDEELESIKNQT